MAYEDLRAFLTYYLRSFDPDIPARALLRSFTVECLDQDELPYAYREALTKFRHLGTNSRLSMVKRAREELKKEREREEYERIQKAGVPD